MTKQTEQFEQEPFEAAVVVAVGREVQKVPVGLDRWREVRNLTRAVVRGCGEVYTEDAVGHGVWDGRSEESVTVAGGVDASAVAAVLDGAAALAHDHKQDAVAVTVGVTALVKATEVGDLLALEVVDRLRALADALEASL